MALLLWVYDDDELTLCNISPLEGSSLAEVIPMRSKVLWVIEGLRILRRLDKTDDEICQVVHMDVIPLGKALANDRSKPVLQRELGHVIDLYRAGVHGSPAWTTDAWRADDCSLHSSIIVSCQDDLVYVPVIGLVRNGRDLFDVSDVVVLFVRVRRLAVAVFLGVSLSDVSAKACQG